MNNDNSNIYLGFLRHRSTLLSLCSLMCRVRYSLFKTVAACYFKRMIVTLRSTISGVSLTLMIACETVVASD